MNYCVLQVGLGVLGSGQLVVCLPSLLVGWAIAFMYSLQNQIHPQVSCRQRNTSSYQDLKAVEDFAAEVDVVTFEFENMDSQTVEAIERNTQGILLGVFCTHSTDCAKRTFCSP